MPSKTKTKVRWETKTEGMVYITTYVIFHPTTSRGKFQVYYEKREPMDCYSSTLVDSLYKVGAYKTLTEAQDAAVEHEAANRAKED